MLELKNVKRQHCGKLKVWQVNGMLIAGMRKINLAAGFFT